VKEVLEHSGLSLEQIYAVELIGGATRVPKLQVCILLFLFFDNYFDNVHSGRWSLISAYNIAVHA